MFHICIPCDQDSGRTLHIKTHWIAGHASLFFAYEKFFMPIFFFKINFFEKLLQEYHQCLNILDPDQDQHFVEPDLGPNCLQRLSADDTSR